MWQEEGLGWCAHCGIGVRLLASAWLTSFLALASLELRRFGSKKLQTGESRIRSQRGPGSEGHPWHWPAGSEGHPWHRPTGSGDQAALLDGHDEIAPSRQEEVLWPGRQAQAQVTTQH